jgi:soluble lytic murein transglycosylase
MLYKRILFAFLLSTNVCLKAFSAVTQNVSLNTDILSSEFLSELDAEIFANLSRRMFDENFVLKNEIQALNTEEYRRAISFLFLTRTGKPQNTSFSDFSRLYFATPTLPRKDLLYRRMQDYVRNYRVLSEADFDLKFPEIEEMIWFYVIIENENLLSYLNSNRISVNSFLDIIKRQKDFSLLQNILNLKQEAISEMLWEGNVSDALPLILNLPSGDEKYRFLARVFFKTKNEKYKIYATTLIGKRDFEDDGFIYDYIKYLNKTEHYKDALALLMNSKISYNNPKLSKFWGLIEELFRYYIDEKEYNNAYLIVSKAKFNEATDFLLYSRSEFLAGFVAMKFLKDEKLAVKHFEKLYNSKFGNVYTKARGAYFLARTYQMSGKSNLEKKWLTEAAKYITTFYGIASLEKLNEIEPVLLLGLNKFTEKRIAENISKRAIIHKQYFDSLLSKYYKENNEIEESVLTSLKRNINFKIGLIMLDNQKTLEANSFFALSVLDMSEKELKLAFDLLDLKLKRENYSGAIQILNTFSSKAANQGVLIVESYPILDFVLENDFLKQNSLIHAIIKQESNFTLRAISGPGAIGLMQIMPATGKIVSKTVKLDFSINRLKNDYKYNIQLGSYYLDLLLKKFKMSYPFALAGYNAGPNRIPQWQKRYFEPETGEETIDFIELIPFKETREYVLRVMENEIFYDYLIKNHLDSNSILPVLKKDKAFLEFLKQHGEKSAKKSKPSKPSKPSKGKKKNK